MPTVPQFNRQAVQTEKLPGARVPTEAPVEAFGGGVEKIGKALSGAVNSTIDAVAEEIDKANASRYYQLKTDIDRYVTDRETNPKNGIGTFKGETAANLAVRERDQYTSYVESLRGKYGTIKGKWASEAKRYVDSEGIKLQGRSSVHEYKEITEFGVKTIDSSIYNDKEKLANVLVPDNDLEYKAFDDSLKKGITEKARLTGAPKEEVEKEYKLHRSDAISMSIVKKLDSGFTEQAKKIYEKYQGHLNPQDNHKISQLLNNDVAEAQIKAEEIFKLSSGDPMKQEALISKMVPPGELRTKVQKEINYKNQRLNEAQKVYANKVFSQASQELFNNNGDMTKVGGGIKAELAKTGMLDEFGRISETYNKHILVSDPDKKATFTEIPPDEWARINMTDPAKAAEITSHLSRDDKLKAATKLKEGLVIIEKRKKLDDGNYKVVVDDVMRTFNDPNIKDSRRRDVVENDIKNQMALIIKEYAANTGKDPTIDELGTLTAQYIAKNGPKLKELLITDKLYDDAMSASDRSIWNLSQTQLDKKIEKLRTRDPRYGISTEQNDALVKKYSAERLLSERQSHVNTLAQIGRQGSIENTATEQQQTDVAQNIFEQASRTSLKTEVGRKLFEQSKNASAAAAENYLNRIGTQGIIEFGKKLQPTADMKNKFNLRPSTEKAAEGRKAFFASKQYKDIVRANSQKLEVEPGYRFDLINSFLTKNKNMSELISKPLTEEQEGYVYIPMSDIPERFKSHMRKLGKSDKTIQNSYFFELKEIAKGNKENKWSQ